MSEKTRLVIEVAAKILSLRSEADGLEDELGKLVGDEPDEQEELELEQEKVPAEVPEIPEPRENGKRPVGTGHMLSNAELEAEIMRLLLHKPSSLRDIAKTVHASPKRVGPTLLRMEDRGQIAVKPMQIHAGNKIITVDRFIVANKAAKSAQKSKS